jgi:transposase
MRGLGTRVHDSGMTTRTGKITKAGRRDLRVALVEAAHVVANSHPHWKAELARLEPRLGRNRAIVAIARKLLVTVWHVLAGQRRQTTPSRKGIEKDAAGSPMKWARQIALESQQRNLRVNEWTD